jgi:hypothetical protein
MAGSAADEGGFDDDGLDDEGWDGGLGHVGRAALVVVVVLGLGIAASFGWSIAGGRGMPEVAKGAGPHGLAAISVQPAVVTVGIYPGSRVMLSALAVNTSDRPVRIGALMLDPAHGRLGFQSSRRDCRVPVLTFSRQDHRGRGWIVPPRRGGLDGVLRIAMPRALTMGLLAEQACQGARFAVFLRPVA